LDGVDYSLTFDGAITTFANIETVSGETIFDSSNIERDVTHKFYIRFRDSITQEKWINFKNELYDILTVENLDERNEFLLLRASKRGPDTKPVNEA